MLTINIEVPKPSRYVSHETVDEIALEANRAYREKVGDKRGFPVDMDRFIDLLEVSILREDIDEPEGASFFANFCPDDGGLITVNNKHSKLFESRPDVYCACLAHEGGHCILRHSEKIALAENAPMLFEELEPPRQLFHKSSWYQYGLSRDEVQKQIEISKQLKDKLVRAALLSETARQTLAQMQDRFEPEWMFRQAEHFSICLRIPRDYLLEQLEEGWNFNSWAPIYRLAERFGVSPSMMRVRLEKLGVIDIGADGKPHLKPSVSQGGLFH